MCMGTTLGTPLHRWLQPEDYVPCNKVTHTIIQYAPTPTTTEYGKGGAPWQTELQHLFEACNHLPAEKLYYAAISTPETRTLVATQAT